MKKRMKLKSSYSKKLFSRSAAKSHKKNDLNSLNLRGGIRL